MSTESEVRSRIAPALLELAYGAASIGERAHAEHAAATALDLAKSRGEADVIERVEELLESMQRGKLVEECTPTDMRSRTADQFAEELVEALKTGVEAD